MSIPVLGVLFGVGLLVGLVSGLIGIGGGVLIVPFLYLFYASPGWSGVEVSPVLATTVAHATSLFVIVPTALRGTWAYHRAGLVSWRAALPIAAGAMASAVVGALIAPAVPQHVLRIAFGGLLTYTGFDLARGERRGVEREGRRPRLWTSLAAGLLVGVFSAMLGVGGGIIAIPLLIYVVGLDLQKVAATSLAIVMFSALAGTVTYGASGMGAGAPPGSVGYVHITAALPILLGSVLSVRWGATLNQRLGRRRLRRLFSVLFLGLGIYLIVRNAILIV
jgi:uncharacterized membrane protein YfcA